MEVGERRMQSGGETPELYWQYFIFLSCKVVMLSIYCSIIYYFFYLKYLILPPPFKNKSECGKTIYN